ncbi:MAG: hypothetical protein Fues2KO_43320 [Fuerstiella sp.]
MNRDRQREYFGFLHTAFPGLGQFSYQSLMDCTMTYQSQNDASRIESLEPMILLSASPAELNGTDADDVLIAFLNGQTVDGDDGSDVLIGLGGDNVLKGGAGSDRFITVLGENVIDGGDGDDTLQFLNRDIGDFDIVDRGNGIVEISNAVSKNFVVNVETFRFLDQFFTLESLLSHSGGNNAPTIVDPDTQHVSVSENETFVVDVNAEDLYGDTLQYSLASGGDNDLFEIDAQTGELKFKAAADFENPADANSDNIYDVTIVVTDGQATVEKTIWITVQDVDEGGNTNNAPSFTNITEDQMIFVTEGETMVVDADAEDPDGDALTYSLSDGIGIPGSGNNEDAGAFNIDAQTGKLTFKSAPDFDNPGDADGDNQYHVTLVVQDSNGAAQERQVVVKIQEQTQPANNAPEFTNVQEGEVVWVAENTTYVGDADAQDADGDTLTYSIVAGADAAKFTIDAGTGVVEFANAPDFENPSDADGDNRYELRLRVSDGDLFQDRNVVIKVADRNDTGTSNRNPYFTNVHEGEKVYVHENATWVGDADAKDPDGDSLTYSISGGPDAQFFEIDADTGKMSFKNAPDFENPADADYDNRYEVRLKVADGKGGHQERNVVICVFDRNEHHSGHHAPFFTNVSHHEVVWFNENTTFVGDADAFDKDGDALTFSIVGGADASFFRIESTTGKVFFREAPDFEHPHDSNKDNFYELTLRVSDGKHHQDRTVFVAVEDVAEHY